MKIIIKTLLLIFLSQSIYSQITVFGIDIAKKTPAQGYFEAFKTNCAPKTYFSYAEYKSFNTCVAIIFENYNVTNKTPQMKDTEKYLPELNKMIENKFGKPIDIYTSQEKTSKRLNYNMYLFTYKSNYYEIIVKVSGFKTTALQVSVYDNIDKLKDDVASNLGYDSYYGTEYYYDKEIFNNIKEYVTKK
ncbi:MAG: hypothetical protein IPM51_15340 [Sphingobacteriaceae bacterium]|nr:hypothetical protein [Sphingobacteriaceae bacterium]